MRKRSLVFGTVINIIMNYRFQGNKKTNQEENMNYTIESREGLKVTVSDLGAEMIGIRLEETEYLWQANPAYWNEHAPVLFPYVGRLTGGKYRIGNREYQMKIHGFASLSTFEAEKRSGSCIAFTLKDSPETMMMYPFRFLFRVIYTVEGHSLKIRYEVENPGQASAEDILDNMK